MLGEMKGWKLQLFVLFTSLQQLSLSSYNVDLYIHKINLGLVFITCKNCY